MSKLVQNRIIALDGLRGLAALIVAVRHVSDAVPASPTLRREILEGPLAILLNSQGAVQLFFVLSGFVLAASVERNRSWSGVVQFYTKRISRLHPPFVFTVLFSWVLSFGFLASAPSGHLTSWIARSTLVHLTPGQVLISLTFPGVAFGLLPHCWTLTVEMILSFLMPPMVSLAHRSHWMVLVGLSAFVVLLGHQLHILWYSIHFSLGIGIYLERERIERFMAALPSWIVLVFALGSLYLFAAPLLLGWSYFEPHFGTLEGGRDATSIWVMGIGSAGLVILANHVHWANHWLASRPLAFLGRISFSIYLLHRVFITLCAPYVDTGSRLVNVMLLLGLVLGTTLPLSAISYRYIEGPSIRGGNWICRWIAARTHSASVLSHASVVSSRRHDL